MGAVPTRGAHGVSWSHMSLPRVVAVAAGSPAARAGLLPGDEILAMDGQAPRDVIEYQLLADQAQLELEVRRGGLELRLNVSRDGGESLGIEVDAALSTGCARATTTASSASSTSSRRVCAAASTYVTTTTACPFSTATSRRSPGSPKPTSSGSSTEGLSPLWVSIHATDPAVRARMLRNRRGATSLRWLRALLDHGDRGPRPGRGVPGDQRRGHPRRHAWPVSWTATPSWPAWRVSRSGSAGSTPRRRCGPTPVTRPRRSWTWSRCGRPCSPRRSDAPGVRLGRVLPARRAGPPPGRVLR